MARKKNRKDRFYVRIPARRAILPYDWSENVEATMKAKLLILVALLAIVCLLAWQPPTQTSALPWLANDFRPTP